MKIIFVCAAGTVAGKERQNLEYLRFLRDSGHDVFCATSSFNDGAFSKLLSENNIPSQRLRLGYVALSLRPENIKMTLHQLIYVPSLWFKYRKLLRSFKPDVVVHCNFDHLLLLLPAFGRSMNVYHVHDVFPKSKGYRRIFKLINKHVTAFIGVSNYVCKSLLYYGLPPEKIKLVYNGIRPPKLIAKTTNAVCVIGIVGQIGPWKGHDVLIEALYSLLNFSWKLRIVGAGGEQYVHEFKEKISKYGMSDRVEFAGRLSTLEDIYKGIDFVCVPSLVKESFGLAAAEPGFFEIPVIATDRGGLAEIVLDAQTGIIVPSNDPVALASAISKMLTDPELRLRYGRAAYDHVKKTFSINSTGSLMAETLHNLRLQKPEN